MCANDVTLEVGDESYFGRVNTPEEPTDRGVLLVPGAGHGPFGDIFLRISEQFAKTGYTAARFETWPFPDDLTKPEDDDEWDAEIAASVAYLKDQGCSDITVVAKSFGGRVTLQNVPDTVDRLILWAPAIKFGEEDEVPSITAAELDEIAIPVRILQGDEDEVMSVENAAKIAEALPQGELVELSGENHSLMTDHQRTIDETMAFLPDES